MTGVILRRAGIEVRTVGQAWWTSHALEVEPGRIEVARIHAVSTTLRRASDADVKAGKAKNTWTSHDYSADYTGNYVEYMPGLTEDELREYNLTPGITTGYSVVDGPRPKTNRADKPANMASYQRAMNLLQSEGYDE